MNEIIWTLPLTSQKRVQEIDHKTKDKATIQDTCLLVVMLDDLLHSDTQVFYGTNRTIPAASLLPDLQISVDQKEKPVCRIIRSSMYTTVV